MEGKDAMPARARLAARLTYDDFVRFPDDGLRHEIVDGVHYVTPSPNAQHQVLVGRLYFAIESHLRAHRSGGQVFLSPFDVVLSRWDVVEPDLLYIAGDQPDILTDQNVQGAPALLIEVLSPSTRQRDEHLKRQLFERTGVREYWLVDPRRGSVRVFRRAADDSFPSLGELSAARQDSLTTPLLSGFSLALSELFAAER